jgi:myo-inositol-1-phosphate synthase
MAPNFSTNSSGYNTPDAELESILPVHPTSARRPHSIVVHSDNVWYTDEHITAQYLNRSAEVAVTDGQFTVTPTVQPYEFQTTKKVGNTGYVAASTILIQHVPSLTLTAS